MHTEYLTISSDNEAEMVVVSFKPGGSFPFIQQPLYLFNDKVIHASKIFSDVLELRKMLILANTPDKKIELTANWCVIALYNLFLLSELFQCRFVSAHPKMLGE